MLDSAPSPSPSPSDRAPPASNTAPPSSLSHPSSMAECRNFFDSSSSNSCRSSSSSEKITAPFGRTEHGKHEDHSLDLTLGLSLRASASKPKQHDMIRPLPVYPHLDKQRSGNFASLASAAAEVAPPALGGQSDAGTVVKALLSARDSAFSLPLPSRDQVWQTLQKNGAVFGQDTRQSDGPKPFRDEAPSMWSRRSASAQVTMRAEGMSDVVIQPIRRSCSNGVLPHPPSRRVSSIESFLERSPERPTSSMQHHQQEALELQRKKEMQAQRRQEARKRRRSLIEEKQQKKARQNSGLQRLGSKQCVSPNEKFSLVSAPSVEGDDMPEAQLKPLDERKSAKQGDDKKVRRSRNIKQGAHTEEAMQETRPLHMKDGNVNMLAQSTTDLEHASHDSMHIKGGKFNMPSSEYDITCHGSMHAKGGKSSMPSNEHDLSSHSSMQKMMSSEFEHMSHGSIHMKGVKLITPTNEYDHASHGSMQKMMAPHGVSAPVTDISMNVNVQSAKHVNEGEGVKSFPSNCSETESAETKEENISGQTDSSELQSSSQKSATGGNNGYGVTEIAPSVFPSMAMTSSSMAYQPPFPVLPVSYSYPVPGATPATMPMQVNFSSPCFMQYPSAGIGENGNANPISSSPQNPNLVPLPVSSSSSLYSMPTPDGIRPWYSATCAGRIQLSSGTLVLNSTTSKDCVGENSEGKWRDGVDKSAFSNLQRTASYTNQVIADPQSSVMQLESQISVSARQLSSASGVVSHNSTDNGQKEKSVSIKNLPIERQPSFPLASRIAPHNSGVLDQSISCLQTERSILGSKGLDVRQEMPADSGTLRMGKGEAKQEEAVKQEEGSSESQLASEHSGPAVSYVQSGVINKQRSGSFPDLPWVTTTGTGPNGKTISGVMYLGNGRLVRLVCSCHGMHMSPAEFVEHSGSTDLSNPERNIVVNPFPLVNQLASTPV